MSTPKPNNNQPPVPNPLRERMTQDLQLRGMAERTQEGYLRAVRKLAIHFHTSPDQLSQQQVTQYFLYLLNDCHFAPGSLRVAYSGIKFFYTFTCQRDWDVLRKMRIPSQKTLPDVLTMAEVRQLIGEVRQPRNATYFWTVYSLGLRLEEGLNLSVGDLDAQRMLVHVHRGKGAKDRFIPLPSSTLQILRDYWRTHRHSRLLFPALGRNKQQAATTTRPMDATTVQGCIKQVVRKLGWQKKVSTHTLRHSYATHLFEAGVSLRLIQKYLGHSSLQTTLVYLRLTETAEADGREELERIMQPGELFTGKFNAGPQK